MNTKRRLIDLVKGVEGVRQIWRIIEEYEKPYPHCSRKLNSAKYCDDSWFPDLSHQRQQKGMPKGPETSWESGSGVVRR